MPFVDGWDELSKPQVWNLFKRLSNTESLHLLMSQPPPLNRNVGNVIFFQMLSFFKLFSNASFFPKDFLLTFFSVEIMKTRQWVTNYNSKAKRSEKGLKKQQKIEQHKWKCQKELTRVKWVSVTPECESPAVEVGFWQW